MRSGSKRKPNGRQQYRLAGGNGCATARWRDYLGSSFSRDATYSERSAGMYALRSEYVASRLKQRSKNNFRISTSTERPPLPSPPYSGERGGGEGGESSCREEAQVFCHGC